jgi:catalase
MLTMKLIESLVSLNRQKLPEPLTHAKGAGAKGIFIPYASMKEYTKACFLQSSEIETPVFVRFSRMMGRPGAADTARDVRGFSVKFSTEEGMYDMLGSSLPVSFIRDPGKYPDLYNALSPCPKTNIHYPEQLWRFVADNPECMHMITWLYTNRGTIKSYRGMEGHSVHTYVWQNAKNDRYWVRYHWRPEAEFTGVSCQEAEFLSGYDPDVATRDLYETFEEGGKVYYELCIQLISVDQSIEDELSLLDPTVIWPESSVPLIRVGRMILDRGIENYYEEVEKCCFSPGRLVSGIGLSIEPMLIAMCLSAMNYEECPSVDCDISLSNLSKKYSDDKGFITGQLAWRLRSMDEDEKEVLIENMGKEMLFIEEELQQTIIGYLKDANESVGMSLEKWLRIY